MIEVCASVVSKCVSYILSSSLINPRRACAARVKVVAVSVCVCVCLSVCPLSHISPPGLLFVLKTQPCTQLAMKVKKFVAFSLKLLLCQDRVLPPFDGHT